MKHKSQNKWLLLTTVLMFLIVSSYGVIKSVQKTKSITESYNNSITLKDTVVIDDRTIVEKYGEPVTLEAGTAGRINDKFNSYGEKHGYEHIKAEFTLEKNEIIDVILCIDYEAEFDGKEQGNNATRPSQKSIDLSQSIDDMVIDKTILDSTPRISISKIENSQTIVSEFNLIRERYYQEVRQTIIKGGVIAGIIALAMAAGVWLVKLIVRKEKVGKVLLILSICIDVVMLLVDVVALNLTLAM